MIKVIWAARRLPGLSDDEFYRMWRQVHGPFYTRTTPGLRRYIQHHTLAEARGGNPAPTHDSASIGWFDDVATVRNRPPSPPSDVPGETSGIFDPIMSVVVATERPVLDGPKTPDMVKLLAIADRKPGLSAEAFSKHWYEVHGPLATQVPGLRRYVQNHGIAGTEEYRPGMMHDGWSELWFDDLASLRRARSSPEWKALSADSPNLFDQSRPMDYVVARETPIVP